MNRTDDGPDATAWIWKLFPRLSFPIQRPNPLESATGIGDGDGAGTGDGEGDCPGDGPETGAGPGAGAGEALGLGDACKDGMGSLSCADADAVGVDEEGSPSPPPPHAARVTMSSVAVNDLYGIRLIREPHEGDGGRTLRVSSYSRRAVGHGRRSGVRPRGGRTAYRISQP